MPLAAGTKLGHYEIVASIGKGGMGEVYRAHDPRVGRDVAIKVSAEQFNERFEREAKVIASLNHPNICTLFDVGPNYLVMELVDGESPQGPLPIETALSYARQIIDALEAAHERGVVHRDLKPGNIKIKPDGTVKVLDFGLAKVASASSGVEQSENSPTLSMAATQAGMILGTAAYMSPEQARGKPTDKRADIWAFGVVLYEMLTGKRLFKGEDITEILASVVKEEPDWEQVPQQIRRVVRACLRKNPKDRLRDIADARLLLVDEAAPQIAAPAKSNKIAWAAAAALLIAASAASWIAWRATRPVEHPLIRLSVDLGPDAVPGARTTAAISPDGTRVAFPARSSDGKVLLASRLLNQAQGILLPGTENAADPFFSADGQWIGFTAGGKLKKTSVQGGAPVTLCDAANFRGASWGEDGNIVAALNGAGGLWLVPESGGTPKPLTELAKGETTHRWPQVLPGGKAVLFTISASTGSFAEAALEMVSIETGKITNLKRRGSFGRYVPTNGSTGHLLYVDQGVVFGAPFDPARMEISGTPAPMLEDVAVNVTTAGGQFDVSRNGTLVYLAGKLANQNWPAVWLDSKGTQPLLPKPGAYFTPRLSPDGQRLALAVSGGKGEDLYVYDPKNDTMTRLTFKESGATFPVWAPDGKHIAYRAPQAGGYRIEWIRSDGGGEPQTLLENKNDMRTFSFTPDGRRLAYFEIHPDTGNDLLTLEVDTSNPERPKAGKPEVFLRTPSSEQQPEFSPDGHWMAYTSNETGRTEIYVRPFPGPGGKWQVSSDGGDDARWSPNGHELFFETIAPDNRIMVADYTIKGDTFSVVGKPRRWSDTQLYANTYVHKDLAPDGKRFVIFPRPEAVIEAKGNLHLTFLFNYFDELRRRVSWGK